MTFKELLSNKNITGYALAKNAGIPYTNINDLINGKTIIQNISLKYAIKIADNLGIDVRDLLSVETFKPIEFRYFRNNLLHDLKRKNQLEFVDEIVKSKQIDFYYKNSVKEYAYYLLALIDYLCRINNVDKITKRYNELRNECLDKPYFVGGNILTFDSIEEAEKIVGIKIIPEFKKFNIIEEDIFNIA